MRHSFRLLSSLFAVLVSLAAVADVPAFADEPLKGTGGGLQLLEQLMWTKEGADSITATMAITVLEDKYCLPPDEPNKDQERAWLKRREATLATYVARYNALQPDLLKLVVNDATALKAVMGKLNGANPTDDTFWQAWQTAFAKARRAIQAKRTELESIREEDCTPPPPPPEQPVDWTAGLAPPEFGPPDFPPLPKHHCSWDEYWALIRSIHPYYNKSAEDAQVASRYRDRVGARLLRAKDAGAPADAIATLEAMFKAASAVAAERLALSEQAKRHYAKAKAIPVIDCRPPEQPQPPPDGSEIPGPDYENYVYPSVPDRFCSEEEKQAVLSQLQAAKDAARRNYEKAKAHVAELEKRINGGDRTRGLPQALQNAREAAKNNFNKEIELDAMYYKALAMPVEKCGGVTTGARAGAEAGTPTGVIPGAEAGAQMGTRAATGKEIGFNFSGGFKQTDTPQTWIGRIVVAGEDTALARTPDTLEGYFAGAYIEVAKTSGEPLFGDSASLGVLVHFSSVEGDQAAVVDTPAGGATGYVFIDPTDPGRPVLGTGIATGFGSWETRTSADQRTFDVAAIYREFLGRDVSLGAGVFVRAQDTELSGWQSHLGVPGLTANERYDISTVDVGAMFEALLRREPSRGVFVEASAFVAPTIASRDYQAVQRTTAPAPFSFDYTQRRDFDDDGFNLHYGVNASIGIEVADGYRLSLIAGWQGETDAPTIRPADGSAPGAPIGPDTESASEWHVGLKLGGPLN